MKNRYEVHNDSQKQNKIYKEFRLVHFRIVIFNINCIKHSIDALFNEKDNRKEHEYR